jgi:hypothetical protein
VTYPHEFTFPRSYAEAWLRYGVFPPPLHGDAGEPRVVHYVLAAHDLWDLEGPPLSVSDEERTAPRGGL